MGDNSKMESDLSFVYMTSQLNVLYNLMKYHKISQKVEELWPAQDLTNMGENSRTESELLFLLCDTPTQCPLQLDQVS